MLVAPSEPPLLKRIGTVSAVPERHGVDFMWVACGRKIGVQRKAVSDFVGSVIDGRLSKEVGQMRQLAVRALILEGPLVWSCDGAWMGRGFRWDHARHDQAVFSLQAEGIWVLRSDGHQDTIRLIGELDRWSRKEKHHFARARGAAVGQWGTPSSREFALHLLQGLPNVGPELAERIYDHFGGVPWQWAATEKDLLAIEGIGKVRARAMLSCLPASPAATPAATPAASPAPSPAAPGNPYPSTDTPQATSPGPLSPTTNGTSH